MRPLPFRLFFPVIVAVALLQGCYIADAVLVEETVKPVPLQKECENAVQTYIRSKSGNLIYTSYGFTTAEIHVPQEIFILEEMEKNREEGFLEGSETDSIIHAKKEFIEANRIQRTAHLEHFYTLRNSNETITILETNFILDDTLGVLDFKPIILIDVPVAYETALNYYMNEYTIFASQDIIEARKLSNRFYYFFKRRQEEFTDLSSKSAFLFHALKVTRFVMEKKELNAGEFIAHSTQKGIAEAQDTTTNYLSIAFSPLYEKSYEGKITGYYIFHKFSLTKDNVTEIYAIRVDVSPYYEIISTAYLESPFDSYFN